ncbi:3'(2'),5'-bisphosphate nucleotidase [Achlya hypogyna]|uniref:3'(2'),5'-bisphosphate nucleotidase n=1 Tax=Achlya hypogyna TaxID=1202772 RepID=A0A1V9Z094_ACHHY|nr:3'(2'),5'-bisphosphate nucleotidase [Achlya hypogyna]
MTSFDAIEVVSACLHLSAFAGAVIRDVVASGQDLDTINKADVGIAHFDPQTVADRRSQQRIVASLRRHYGESLQIVGEEGHLEPPAAVDITTPNTALLRHHTSQQLSATDLIVWIDPLDGTRKFTEKAYDQVSVLIGLSYQGRPIAGVMHLPFVGTFGTTYYGGPLLDGVFMSTLPSAEPAQWQFAPVPVPPTPSAPQRWGISETRCAYIESLLGEDDGRYGRWEKGATGILMLDVVRGHCDAYARWIPRTKKWDICVGEAFIVALGGAVTDIFGESYEYGYDETQHGNATGVFATLDRELLATVASAARALRSAHKA